MNIDTPTVLCKLAYKYGTDKCPQISHPYTPFYYELLRGRRKSIKKVLEIGIGSAEYMHRNPKHYVTGASLRMWRDFFPNAQIYGADIDPKMLFKDKRIDTFLCDERNADDIAKLISITGRDIDLFIDDGLHNKGSQIFLCKTVLPLLKKKVLYIIEDVAFPRTIASALNEYDCYEPKLSFKNNQRLPKNRILVITKKKMPPKKWNISFFASPYLYGINYEKSSKPILFRGSSLIRGEQVAQYLGGKYNPTEGFENDLCIHIKPKTVAWVKKGGWVDVVDSGHHFIEQLRSRPDIKVIAYTKLSGKYLRSVLKNKIVVIPEHHCNFERFKRTKKEFTTGGIVTTPSPFADEVYKEVNKRLAATGLKFLTCYHFRTRQDVVDFYKQIDFQIIGYFGYGRNSPFAHPNKIINAASFGIPTIAVWKLGYGEFEKYYIPIENMDELMLKVEKLKNKDYYEAFAKKIMAAAAPYHISKIAKLYKKLT